MIYVPTPSSTINPSWTDRNKIIASNILPNSNILDLGCGHKDLLNYITPKTYLGIDYNDVADLSINFNLDFTLPDENWDYIVCSGLLEYLNDIPKFLLTIKHHAKRYIISYWSKNSELRSPNNLPEFTMMNFEEEINRNFQILSKLNWKKHTIFILEDLT